MICDLFFVLRHQPGWRTQTTPVKNNQTLSWRHVQVSQQLLHTKFWDKKTHSKITYLYKSILNEYKSSHDSKMFEENAVIIVSLNALFSFCLAEQQFLIWPRLWLSERLLRQVSKMFCLPVWKEHRKHSSVVRMRNPLFVCHSSLSIFHISWTTSWRLLTSVLYLKLSIYKVLSPLMNFLCLIPECTRTHPVSPLPLPPCRGPWSRLSARESVSVAEEAAGEPRAASPLPPRAVRGLPRPEQVSVSSTSYYIHVQDCPKLYQQQKQKGFCTFVIFSLEYSQHLNDKLVQQLKNENPYFM